MILFRFFASGFFGTRFPLRWRIVQIEAWRIQKVYVLLGIANRLIIFDQLLLQFSQLFVSSKILPPHLRSRESCTSFGSSKLGTLSVRRIFEEFIEVLRIHHRLEKGRNAKSVLLCIMLQELHSRFRESYGQSFCLHH